MRSEVMSFRTSSNFEEVYLEIKSNIDREGFLLLHEIDTQMILSKNGYKIRPLKQLLFFHPKYMDLILKTDPLGISEIPIKIVIYQLSENEVEVSVPDPAEQFKEYNGLEKMGVQLQTTVLNILGKFHQKKR